MTYEDFRVLPKRRLGLKRFVALDPDCGSARISHKDKVVFVVAARRGATLDGFHAMLVIRESSIPPMACEVSGELAFDADASTLKRPIMGLVVCPLASQTNTPDPRTAAKYMELGPAEAILLLLKVVAG